MCSKFFLLLVFTKVISCFAQADTAVTYGPSRVGIGAEIGPCTGYYFLSGEVTRYIDQGWCYANVGVTVSYKKTHYSVRLGGLSGSIKETFQYSSDWVKGNRVGSVNLQANVGYEFLNTKRFNIIPCVGAGVTAFNSGLDSVPANPYATNFKFSFSAGSSFDLKLHIPVLQKNKYPGTEYEEQYLALRIYTGIYPAYFHSGLNMNGNLYFINFSLFGFGRGSREL